MSVFDPEAFLDATINETFETKYPLVPDDEYEAILGEPIVFVGLSKEKGEPYAKLTIPYLIDDLKVEQATGLKMITVRQQFFLQAEFHPDGSIARLLNGPGKNIKLGRVRAAVGQENPPWNMRMLNGSGPVRVKVRIGLAQDKVTEVNEVVNVAKI